LRCFPQDLGGLLLHAFPRSNDDFSPHPLRGKFKGFPYLFNGTQVRIHFAPSQVVPFPRPQTRAPLGVLSRNRPRRTRRSAPLVSPFSDPLSTTNLFPLFSPAAFIVEGPLLGCSSRQSGPFFLCYVEVSALPFPSLVRFCPLSREPPPCRNSSGEWWIPLMIERSYTRPPRRSLSSKFASRPAPPPSTSVRNPPSSRSLPTLQGPP